MKKNSKGKRSYRIQISNTFFYDFLITIGLMPAKSPILSRLKIPHTFFRDFLRGVIDGDGSIRHWIHNTNMREQWSLTIYSGSLPFIEWLRDTIEILLKVRGKIHQCKKSKTTHNNFYVLKYGKLAAAVILEQCYYPGALCLERKRR